MTTTISAEREILADLRRLVEALDLRVPRPERFAEAQIALDAADLRDRAMRLIENIERATHGAAQDDSPR